MTYKILSSIVFTLLCSSSTRAMLSHINAVPSLSEDSSSNNNNTFQGRSFVYQAQDLPADDDHIFLKSVPGKLQRIKESVRKGKKFDEAQTLYQDLMKGFDTAIKNKKVNIKDILMKRVDVLDYMESTGAEELYLADNDICDRHVLKIRSFLDQAILNEDRRESFFNEAYIYYKEQIINLNTYLKDWGQDCDNSIMWAKREKLNRLQKKFSAYFSHRQ